MSKARRKHKKKARFLDRGIGLSYRKASRALNLRLAPLSNTRVSARGVRLGLARRFGRVASRRVAIWRADCVGRVDAGRVAIRSISARRFGRVGRADSVVSRRDLAC